MRTAISSKLAHSPHILSPFSGFGGRFKNVVCMRIKPVWEVPVGLKQSALALESPFSTSSSTTACFPFFLDQNDQLDEMSANGGAACSAPFLGTAWSS